jgi:rSAM-associated Gly-rich repeat protein
MTEDRRTLSALAALLPAGTLGLSVSLAAADARASTASDPEARTPGAIEARLGAIRRTVSTIVNETPHGSEPFLKVDAEKRLAWWGNGWHNGGWNNWGNGWQNGGWGNVLPLPILPQWGNGWQNGGWHNWGNGWHNGWHNW